MNPIEIAALSLQLDAERMKVLSHNVANMTSTGYKRQVAVQTPFASVMEAARLEAAGLSVHTDGREGKLRATGNALDLAMGANEYLALKGTGTVPVLTRAASLRVDADGRLLTAAGQAVLGSGGGEVTVPKGSADLRIDNAGVLWAGEVNLASLQLVRVDQTAQLNPLGDGLFEWQSDAKPPVAQTVSVRSGHLETSNVVPAQEMVNLMGTTRHAESMARLLQSADEMMDKAIRKFGDLS